ncbi:MAG: xanthine dehydrogenase family protein molybdopterin-binding subunit [Deltaproteobacteria bacterium]|uniref:xanthine dehydrogenase family protein molybdopterin-binding subunit n=1 Tax=Desulfobacula sp. TaxID=2593537 RepID=UPI0019A31102|nr:xanthine dehydrogenase family protein molybdopterin-binding subunit [Candidatus Desulfobacula maris]MBL6993745.1 xanthine dehydrogenase family protein molybdopterin-binding subunit [Desulfobacula sp.]
METNNKYEYIGKSERNVNGIEKVTGAAKYCSDMELSRMLYGKVKRSPYPHARIISIDTSKAKELPGVKVVIVGDEKTCPHRFGAGVADEYVLARDKVLYVGDAVAAVAAETEDIAQDAVDLIEVEYEELEPVFDGDQAFSKNPPAILHEDLKSYKTIRSVPPRFDENRPNVFNYFRIRRNNAEEAFKEADIVLENRFEVAMIHHVQMEPHCGVAKVDGTGRLIVWGTTSKPYGMHKDISESRGMASSAVRVIVPTHVGGAFGGREPKAEQIAASLVLAQKGHPKRPVKMRFTREEQLSTTTTRARYIVEIKTGAKKDGTLVANAMRTILVGGAYAGTGYLTARNGSFGPAANYKIPNFSLDAYGVYTNQRMAGAFRGFGNAETLWGMESNMDMLAEALNIDPLEFRLMNCIDEGDLNAFQEKMHSVGAKECLQAAARDIEWGKKPEKPKEPHLKMGKGIALGNKYSLVPTASACFIKVHPDGLVELRTSTVELGQGSNTIFSQMISEEFKIPVSMVRVLNPDTDITPFDLGTASSRSTFNMGNAIRKACADAKKQLFELAATELGVAEDVLETADSRVFVKDFPEKSLHIKDLFIPMVIGGYTLKEGAEILGKATYYLPGVMPDPETGASERPASFYMFVAQAAEVEVDTQTGKIRVTKMVTANDCGKAINPMMVEGQQDGGVLSMGIGSALLEEVITDNGVMLNPQFADYKIPTTLDCPDCDNYKSAIIETAHREGPWGAKGVGEGTMVSSAPAIANAIYDAIGIRFHEIPITPEKVLRALKEKNQESLG